MDFKGIIRKLFFLVFFLTLFSTAFSQSSNASKTDFKALPATKALLSASEKQFIKDHPEIYLGIDAGWEPYVIQKADGSLEGFEVDIIDHINKTTGATIRLKTGRWKDLVEQAKKREIDGLALSAKTPARTEHFLFSDSYFSTYPAIILRADDPRTLESLDRLSGESIAFLAGNKFYQTFFSRHPEISVIEMPTEEDAIRLVVEGKATAAVVDTTSFNKYSMRFAKNIRLAHIVTEHPLKLLYSIRKDRPELVNIINKGLGLLTPDQTNQSHRRWFGIDTPQPNPDKLVFTAEERAWIDKKHPVRVYVGNYLPYYAPLSANQAKGMAIDYLKLISEKADLKFEYVTHMDWPEAFFGIIEQEGVDLLPAAYITDERKKKLHFTNTYLESPSIIMVRDNSPFISSLSDLRGKTLATEKNYATAQWLAEKYPEIRQLSVDTTTDALHAVSSGQADAFIGNLIIATYISRTQGLANLKVAAPSPFKTDSNAMAIRQDWPELASIIDKTLASFTEEEHETIRARWLPPVRYEHGVSESDLFQTVGLISGSLFLVIGGILFWNKRLAREIAAKKEAENRLASILRASPVGIGLTVERRFNFINDQFALMLGRSKEELLGQSSRICYASDEEFESVGKHKDQEIQRKGVSSIETEFKHKDGTLMNIILSSSPIDQNDLSKGVIFSALDISEQKKAQKSLAESEDRFRSLFHKHSAIFLLVDPENGAIIDANRSASEFYGYTNEEITQLNIIDINPLSTDIVQQKIREATVSKVNHFIFPHRLKNGEIKTVEVHTNLIPIKRKPILFSIIHDISDRKKAEEALALERAHLHTLINTLPDLIWLKDAEGTYLSCNKRFEDFFGAPAEKIIGKTDYDFLDPELVDFFRAHDLKAMQAGGPTTNEETITFASDGHSEHLETIKTPMCDREGNLIGVLGVGRDITERKHSEEELKRLKQEAEKLSEERGVLLKEIHHRVKNNLQVITSMLSLQKRRQAYEETNQALSDAQRRIGIIASAHQKLYETSHLDSINIHLFFHSIIDTIAETSRQKQSITLTKKIGNFEISFDQATSMAQILGELISNAYKHAFTAQRDGVINITVEKNNAHIYLQVKDNGVGFDYNTVQMQEASLGLMLVNAFSDKLQGQMTFKRDQGTIATLQFRGEV